MLSSLKQLRHFEALYRSGSFVVAAREQNISQSTLTKSIKQLENSLGGSLFDRTTRSVHPTQLAQRLIPYAGEILAQADNMEREVGLLQARQLGRIAIGAGPYPMQSLLTRAITIFAQANPEITVSLEAGDQQAMLDKLVNRQLDLIVCDASKYEVSAHIDQMERIPLAQDRVVFVHRADHPLNGRTPKVRELLQYRWAAPSSSPHFLRRMAPRQAAESARGDHPQFRVNSVSACVDLTRTGDVLALVPRSYAMEACSSGEFCWLEADRPIETNDATHLLKNRSCGPAVNELIEIIRTTARELAAR